MVEISHEELRTNCPAVLHRVEAGESFTVTVDGRPVADLVPHPTSRHIKRRTMREVQEAFRRLPPVDAEEWQKDLADADAFFAPDDIDDTVWRP